MSADGLTQGHRSEAWSLRLVAFSALGLFGAMHWAGIVRPGAGGDLLGLLLIAAVAGVLCSAALGLSSRRPRSVSVATIILVALLLILAVAGAPSTTLRPDHWDTLAVNLAEGIGTLPALRMPYRGSEPWVHTVLIAGGGLLLLIAAILALARRPRTTAAALCLTVLYVTAIIEHRPASPYLDGAGFAVLLGTMLWSERLTGRGAPAAVGLALMAVIGSVILAPRLDSARPWVDYQALADSLQGGKTTTFSWNHSYAPLTWPRDGVELARVKAKGDPYIKTADLEDFDGREWRQVKGLLGDQADTEFSEAHPGWLQTIHVDIKALRSEPFLTAGTATRITHSSRHVRHATPGTFETSDRPLRRGDSYDASVYVPDPSATEMHAAGTGYPSFVFRQLTLTLPPQAGLGAVEMRFAPRDSGIPPLARPVRGFAHIDVEQALAASPYAREYALARRLRAGSSDPYDYVLKVIARVQRDARYTEAPPPPGRLAPLDAFLFRDHAGYCQHFAGATALLLRMGGVPARVVAGFSPGAKDGADTHVLRDVDAHSWVEVYFPRLGWVTFDPTPGDSPARSQQTDTAAQRIATPGAGGQVTPGGDRVSDPRAGGAGATVAQDGSGSVGLIVIGALLAVLGGTALTLSVRRRRRLARSDDPEVEELRLALIRSGRPIGPDMTLAKVERLLEGSTDALGYVRALRVARYGAGGVSPTPRQRRALRRELGAGLGMRGRLRALWALPVRSAELHEALRMRRVRSYN
jgi:transglutaminase-like putative cysteine protease